MDGWMDNCMATGCRVVIFLNDQMLKLTWRGFVRHINQTKMKCNPPFSAAKVSKRVDSIILIFIPHMYWFTVKRPI